MSAIRIGDQIPDFQFDSTAGKNTIYGYQGDAWLVLFSHPADFTPVCTTELGAISKLTDEFAKRKTKLIGLSVDSVDSHKGWINDINEVAQTTVSYPIIADHDRKIAKALNMLDQDAEQVDSKGLPLTVRSLFIVDPSNKIRLIITYPASCGRNFDEVLRVLDSMQLTDGKKLCTPANWREGDDVIVAPSVTTDDAKTKYGEVSVVKPYLRTVTWAAASKADA